jgi:general stress protein 26
MRKVSTSLREMFGEETDRTLNYNELERTIIEEAEQYNRIHLATSYNDDVHTFYPLCVFDGLKAYVVFSKEFIWVKHIKRNPKVALTTYNKQFLGEAKILGDPYDDKFWRIRVKFRAKHRLSWDRCINIPKLALIEIRVTHVTLMDYSNEYVPYWKVTQLDAERKEAFWHYILEEFPYWHQIQEPMSLKPRMDSMTVPPPDDSKGDGQ